MSMLHYNEVMKKNRYSNALIFVVLGFVIMTVVFDRSQKISVSEENITTTKISNVISSPTVTPYRVTSTYSIPTSALPKIEFYKKNGESVFLRVEVPRREEYAIGLSGRNTLVERGMLFRFSELVLQPFWMKDTYVELSIAFIAADGTILQIEHMEPKSEKLIVPIALYKYAVEVPVHWYTDKGVTVGDKVHLGPTFFENFTQ